VALGRVGSGRADVCCWAHTAGDAESSRSEGLHRGYEVVCCANWLRQGLVAKLRELQDDSASDVGMDEVHSQRCGAIWTNYLSSLTMHTLLTVCGFTVTVYYTVCPEVELGVTTPVNFVL